MKYSLTLLPGTKLVACQIWIMWFTRWNWVHNSHVPDVLVTDKIDLCETFTSVKAAMICTMLTGNIVVGVPLSIL